MPLESSTTALPHERELGLDGLRGLAALSVALGHYTCTLALPHYDISALPTFFASYGHYGVQLFFIISGFVIFQTLLAKRSLPEFGRARFLRLFPTYWLCLAVTSCVLAAAGPEFGNVTPAHVLSNATMLAGQLTGPHSLMDGSYWTLEYELYFYAILGIVFFKRGAGWAIGCLVLLSLLGVVWNAEGVSGWLQSLPYPIPALCRRLTAVLLVQYAHLFLIGILIHRLQRAHTVGTWTLLAGCLACGFVSHGTRDGAVTTLLASIVMFSVTPTGRSLLGGSLLVALGSISYPLYLLHQEIGYFLIASLNRAGLQVPLAILVCLGSMMLLAAFLNRKLEPHLRRWLTWRPSRPA